MELGYKNAPQALAYAKKAGPMATLHIHPKWDMLREEPGFKDIIAKMNFPN